MDEHATALADAIDEAVGPWVVQAVLGLAEAWSAEMVQALRPDAEAAAAAARTDLLPRVRALLAQDVDDQRTTPLAILRDAVTYPTAVLREAGVPPVERDPYDEDAFPDDVYNLTPAAFADFGEDVGRLGIVWGAAKAWEHRRRHSGGPA